MEGYILAVCGAVILSALVTILLPEGKTGKFINGMLRVFCVAVMLVPLCGLFEKFGAPSLPEGGSEEVALDEGFMERVFSEQALAQAEALETSLSEDPGISVSAEILWECVEYAYTVREVRIEIENFGIYGEDEHIFVIEQVRSRISELFGDPEVIIYE